MQGSRKLQMRTRRVGTSVAFGIAWVTWPIAGAFRSQAPFFLWFHWLCGWRGPGKFMDWQCLGQVSSWQACIHTCIYIYIYVYLLCMYLPIFAPELCNSEKGRLNMAQEAFLGLIQSWSHLGQGVRRGWYDPQRFISQTVAVQKQCMTKALCVLKICLQLSSVVVWHKILMMKSRSWPERRADGQRNLSVTETRVKSSVWSTVRV